MLASLLGLALGAAPPVEPEVSWQAPAGCSDATAVRRRIEDLLRRPLASGEVAVEGVVRAEEPGFVLRLRVRAGEVIDERTLRADRCPALADTAALVAAVMIDPAVADTVLVPEPDAPPGDASDGASPESDGGDATNGANAGAGADGASPTSDGAAAASGSNAAATGSDGAPARDPARPDARDPTAARATTERSASAEPSGAADGSDPSRTSAGLWLRARAGGEFGAVPGGTGGGALGLAFGGPRLRVELEGQYWIGRRAESEHAAARIHLGIVAARVCGVIPGRPLAAALCGGVELGAARAAALEPAPLTRHRPWLAAQAEVALRWQLRPRVALWIGAQPFVPIVFPRFELVDPAAADAPETIHVPTPVGVRGLVGIEVRALPREEGGR